MGAPAPRGPLGFGGAVGAGIAAVILIGALAIGHAVLGQLEGAARIVITFAEIALCVVLGAVVVGLLGGLAYGVQRARLDLAERREQLGGRTVMRAEVITDDAAQLEPGARVLDVNTPAIQAKHGLDVLGHNVVRLPVSERREDDSTWR